MSRSCRLEPRRLHAPVTAQVSSRLNQTRFLCMVVSRAVHALAHTGLRVSVSRSIRTRPDRFAALGCVLFAG